MSKNQAIGVFDSGVGGLTVLQEIIRVLPKEDLIYLGDTARLPYGSKSQNTVIRYATKAAQFLHNQNIKALVIACNTASAYALSSLQNALSIPVLGVIIPGAKEAIRMSKNGQIGVIATTGTVASQAYTQAIKQELSTAVVVEKACPLFVPLAEEGWVEGEIPHLVAKKYFASFALARPSIDTLVLGCTHYPLLENLIQKEIRVICGNNVMVVSSARATARTLFDVLQRQNLLRENKVPKRGERKVFVSDNSPYFASLAKRFLGDTIDLEWVDLIV